MNFKLSMVATTCILLVVSCRKNDVTHKKDDLNKEYKHIALLVTDQADKSLSLIWPSQNKVEQFSAAYANGTPYTTHDGRFAVLVHRTDNFIQTFDLGLEWHIDHVDWVGTPKFGKLTGTAAQPTHFKSKNGEFLTFNDGDGTLSIGRQEDVHKEGAQMATLHIGLLKHHGAMASFKNGTYAVTQKDNSITGTLPERVMVVNKSGATLHSSTLQTKGIHGNASDGEYAVFGSASGILVVTADGTQRLINHPADFGTAWFGTILETANPGQFVGYTAAKGAYLINVKDNSVRPIIENTTIMQCKISYDLKMLHVLLHDGHLNVYNLSNNTLTTSFKAIDPVEPSASIKPQMEATQKFAYISQPAIGELWQVNLHSKKVANRFKLSAKAFRPTILGYESNQDH